MMRVPGGACSWTVRRALSSAATRSASVEAPSAVSTTVRSEPVDRASGREGARETDAFGELPGAPVASRAPVPTAWIETSCPSARTRGEAPLSAVAAPGPAQESVGSTALARAPRPRVSQPSAGQVRSAGVRTERFIGSPSEARVNRWVAAALTSLMPVAVPETWDRRSAQVRLLVPRTTTGAGREDEAVSETDAVGTAAASAEPTIVRIMPMTTSSTRTYTTARTRRC